MDIRTITLALPFRMGTVNCYLVGTEASFILIDTGSSNKRIALEGELESAGCEPGDLDLIILTHGDFDHTGNAAYLSARFGAKTVMHQDDSGMVENGDMFWNRSSGNAVVGFLAPTLFGFPKANRFVPDLYVEEGHNYSEYGFHAQTLSLPGHSRGSIGILTAEGDLFCGDLLENTDKPALNSIMDDPEAAKASVEKLKGFEIRIVYPGHGQPFPMESSLERY